MSDEVPSGRLSQIFDPLTNLQSQQQQHYQQPFETNRQRSNSSSPSPTPSTSGRATPASGGAASNGSAGSSGSSHYQYQHQNQQQQQQHPQQQPNFQYLTHTHNYFHVRSSHEGEGHLAMGHNYLHTFPSTHHTPSHLLLQQQQQHQQQQHYLQQHYQHFQQTNVMPTAFMQHTQQQQHSLPPLYAGPSHSLTASPLLPKRAISFSGQIPLNRQPIEATTTSLRQHQQVLQSTQSTPNSPRLMPRRQSKPPPIPAKPSSIANTSSTASTSSAGSSNLLSNQKDGAQLNPASSLDGADAPWPHFSTLTDYLDVHQVNNYGQQVPEINWQERCLELQLELHRSKNQAGRIRDMLREKLKSISMLVSEFLNAVFCSKQVQIFCVKGSPEFEFTCWCVLSAVAMYVFYLWREGPYYTKRNRLDGKVVIITGCNTGIGKECALDIAARGARVYMACRDQEKCERARREIVTRTGNTNVFNRKLDLASLQSVRDFAAQFLKDEKRLDILINNAGIMSTPRKLTQDGYEQQFAVNHLGHFLLTNLLLDLLKKSAPSRIVVVSSLAHIFGNFDKNDMNLEKSYLRFCAYGRSKLANILFTRKLAKMLAGSQVTVNCLHPGSVQSELTRYDPVLGFLNSIFNKLLLRSTRGGAQTILFLALDPDIEGLTGGYYDRMKLFPLLSKARDDEMADWLWQESEKMVGLKEKAS